MENKVIAQIKLNPGKGGYFDPISRIHLTHGNPFADVYAGMNTTGLKQAVYNKRISLISGSLGVIEPPFKLVKGKDGRMVLVPNKPNKIEEVKEQPKKEEAKVETPASVEKVEVKESVVEEATHKVEETVEEIIPEVKETTEEIKEEIVEEVSEEAEEVKEDEEPTKKKKNKKKKKSEE